MPHGCYDRPRLGELVPPVQDGHFNDGFTRYPKLVPLHFRMNPDCVYSTSDLGKQDDECNGCKWRQI